MNSGKETQFFLRPRWPWVQLRGQSSLRNLFRLAGYSSSPAVCAEGSSAHSSDKHNRSEIPSNRCLILLSPLATFSLSSFDQVLLDTWCWLSALLSFSRFTWQNVVRRQKMRNSETKTELTHNASVQLNCPSLISRSNPCCPVARNGRLLLQPSQYGLGTRIIYNNIKHFVSTNFFLYITVQMWMIDNDKKFIIFFLIIESSHAMF